jgi:predicted nuclease of restriction endonuclease-like RecB superfamily
MFPKYEKLELEYDSDLEESFAKRFVTVTGEWKLIREPEPIISGKTIFIPDFLLIKDDIRVYLEIIGFWTEDYLKRKIEKIRQLKDINLILAIDYSLGDIKIDDPNIVIIKYDKKISSFDIIKALRKFEK